MNSNQIKNFIYTWAILILVIAVLSYSYNFLYPNPVVRERLERIEAFTDKVISDPEGELSTVSSISPSPVNLQKPKEPYSLLLDIFKPYDDKPVSPTSQECYDADFQKRLERTGNFRQLTNNYKRGVPDSCSSPNHDLLLSFYKVDSIPFTGYLDESH
jgi:hypothetical protein